MNNMLVQRLTGDVRMVYAFNASGKGIVFSSLRPREYKFFTGNESNAFLRYTEALQRLDRAHAFSFNLEFRLNNLFSNSSIVNIFVHAQTEAVFPFSVTLEKKEGGEGQLILHSRAAGSADQSLEVYTTNSEGVFTGWHCLHIEFSGAVLKASLDTEEEKSMVITPDTEAGIFYDPVPVLCGQGVSIRSCVLRDETTEEELFSASDAELLNVPEIVPEQAGTSWNDLKSPSENLGLFTNNQYSFICGEAVLPSDTRNASIQTPLKLQTIKTAFTLFLSAWMDPNLKHVLVKQKMGNSGTGDPLFAFSREYSEEDGDYFNVSVMDRNQKLLRISVSEQNHHLQLSGYQALAVRLKDGQLDLFLNGQILESAVSDSFDELFMAESDLSDHFLQIGDSSNGESVSFNTFFIFNQALPDSEIASICSIMAQSFPVHTPTIEPEPEVIEKTIFDFLNNPDSVSDGATVKIIPDGSGQMFYRQVSFGSKVVTVDFSNYEKVTINCSGFTKISDKIYSVTGTFYPWITGNSETKTSISIMED